MTGKYKEFYKFVSCFDNNICKIWEDFYNRTDPKKGDKFITDFAGIVIFDKVDFDSTFKNGVCFIYYFHDELNNEYAIHSINDVYDIEKLTDTDKENLYGFWRYCTPVNE